MSPETMNPATMNPETNATLGGSGPKADADLAKSAEVDDLAPMLQLPEVRDLDRYASSRRSTRSRFAFLATAAAVMALVAGFVTFSSSNTSPALAEVQSAASAAADAGSGRIETTFSLTGSDDGQSETSAGTVLTAYSGADIGVVIDLASGPDELPEAAELRLVDGTLYGKQDGTGGSSWYALDESNFLGQTITEYIDPRTILDTVQELVEVDEVGTVEIEGVATTHYQSTVDLADESLKESGWLVEGVADIQADGEVTIDLYVDEAGALRQLDMSGDLQESGGGDGTATFTVKSRFYDLGADVVIEQPDEAEVIDPFDDFKTDLEVERGD